MGVSLIEVTVRFRLVSYLCFRFIILDIQLPDLLHSIATRSVGLLQLENIGIAVGIALLSNLGAKI